MRTTIAVVGDGIVGSSVAYTLRKRGYSVTLFGRESIGNEMSPSQAAGGLLCPLTELPETSPLIAHLGLRSLDLWKEWRSREGMNFYFKTQGSIALSHSNEHQEWNRLRAAMRVVGLESELEIIDRERLKQLEPDLSEKFTPALFIAREGNLNPRAALAALRVGLPHYLKGTIESLGPGWVSFRGERQTYDWTIDARGISAQADIPSLRKVRGERLTLVAPEVEISHPIRLLHSTIPLYVAPLGDHRYILGATCIESEESSPFAVRSMLELLSAAFTLHTGFADATIEEAVVSHRPALPDNLPRLFIDSNLIRINGLYRHGYLLAPAISELAADIIEGKPVATEFRQLLSEAA